MKAFVITCNDSVEHVYVGTEEGANKLSAHLAMDYAIRNETVFRQPADMIPFLHWNVRPTPITFEDSSDATEVQSETQVVADAPGSVAT